MRFGKALTVPLALFFAFSVLSRQITGVPGAQVEILKSLSNPVLQPQVSQQTLKGKVDGVKPIIEKLTLTLNEVPKEQVKTTYKKYVFSERSIENPTRHITLKEQRFSSNFTQHWLFANIPQVIHAQGPPNTPDWTISLIYLQNSGVNYIEPKITNSSCWRVCLLVSRT